MPTERRGGQLDSQEPVSFAEDNASVAAWQRGLDREVWLEVVAFVHNDLAYEGWSLIGQHEGDGGGVPSGGSDFCAPLVVIMERHYR
jgi:hypothetical protein